MKTSSSFTLRTAVRFALAGQALFAAGHAFAEDANPLGEVVVTGSYIRRTEGFTPASPVDTIGKMEFEEHAPKSIADFMTSLPYNFNSFFNTGRIPGGSLYNGSGTINLRNLGANATLILLNGRRTAKNAVILNSVDVNALVPQIAIGSVEILKDGASATYGSDAVGGVVNFLTRKNVEGFEFEAQGDIRQYGKTGNYRAGGIWGTHNDKTSVMMSLEYSKKDPFTFETIEVLRDRQGTIDGQIRSAGWPAQFGVPNRSATGALTTATTSLADPACGTFAETYPSGSVTRAGLGTYPTTCQSNSVGTSWEQGEQRYQLYGELHHEFSKSFRFLGEIGYLSTRGELADPPSGGVNGTPAITVPGYAPGNPFRAVNATGTPLYAQSSGVQLGYDKNGDGIKEFIPARNAAGQVVVVAGADGIAGTADDAAAGVPFWEDVSVAQGSRPFGLNCGLPGSTTSTFNCGNLDWKIAKNQVDLMRFVAGFEGDFFSDWHYQTTYTFARNHEEDNTLRSTLSIPALRSALAGFGGPGCNTVSFDPLLTGTQRPGQGNCQFFNIFGTAVTAAEGSVLANTQGVIQYINPEIWQKYEQVSKVWDAVVSGTLFNLPAGPFGIAFGGQQRTETWVTTNPDILLNGNTEVQAPAPSLDTAQKVSAFFAEINAPLMNSDRFGSAEFSGAIRHEDTSGPGLSSTDPKFGLLYSIPNGAVKVRGTWSTSFLAPSLIQLHNEAVLFASGVNDYITSANDNLQRVPTQQLGNPNVEPQKSEAYNFGVTLEPIRNLTIDIDRWHFTFKGLIALQSGLALASDPATALNPNIVVRDTAAGVIVDDNPSHATFGQSFGRIVRINATYINNASVETAGYDFGISYRNDLGKFGSLQNSLAATWQTDYNVQSAPNTPAVDRTNNRNSGVTGASFAIDWRATLRTSWQIGNHGVQSLVRFTDGFVNNAAPAPGSTAKDHIESYITWDLAYNFGFEPHMLGLEHASVAVGINNVLDNTPPWVPDATAGHTLPTLYDYSGRHFWIRVGGKF